MAHSCSFATAASISRSARPRERARGLRQVGAAVQIAPDDVQHRRVAQPSQQLFSASTSSTVASASPTRSAGGGCGYALGLERTRRSIRDAPSQRRPQTRSARTSVASSRESSRFGCKPRRQSRAAVRHRAVPEKRCHAAFAAPASGGSRKLGRTRASSRYSFWLDGVTLSTSAMVVTPAPTFCAPDNRNVRMPSLMPCTRSVSMSLSALISLPQPFASAA